MRGVVPLLLLLAACSRESGPPPEEEPPPPRATPAPPAAGLIYDVPSAWRSEAPASALRRAQCVVQDKDKTEGDATFVYFGTMGGGVEGNVNRWKGQWENPPAEPKLEEFKAGGMTVTLLDIAGEYASDMGADPRKDQRGLFAIVETDGGDHIFRLTGPRGTVGDWRDEFVAMLKGARLK